MNNRVAQAWERIERWLAANLPSALENLGDPATTEHINELERTLGFELPDNVKAIYSVHNGDKGMPGLLGGWDVFLSLNRVIEDWRLQVDIANELDGREDTPAHWRHQIEGKIISIKGPVKPLFGSPRWIPITNMNGDVVRYLDFDPAPGGQPGQVIEVDAECCMHQVVADSFVGFLEQYADSLERGDYAVVDGDLDPIDEQREDPDQWGVPDYLRQIEYEYFASGMPSDNPDIDQLAMAEEVVIVGRMGGLWGGGDGIIFTLITEAGNEYSFLATNSSTEGYGAISARRYARVRAERFEGQVECKLITHGIAEVPELLAKSYEMLVEPDGR